jgi:hypothetical protein
MLTPSALVVAAGAAVLATAVTAARRGPPGPKRTHLYETGDGERANPFGDLSEGAREGTDPGGCRNCGTALESPLFRFCVSCGTRSLADD